MIFRKNQKIPIKKALQSKYQLMFFQDIYVDYLNPKFYDDGIVNVASRACQRGPILPRERVLGLNFMFLDPKEVSKPKMSLIKVVRRPKIDFVAKSQSLCVQQLLLTTFLVWRPPCGKKT